MFAELRSISEFSLVSDEQHRDLALVDAGDFLRGMAGSTGLLARISQLRFALALFETPAESLENARARIGAASAGKRVVLGAAIFEPDRPASLDILMQRAEADLAPTALAMRR